MLPMEKFSDEYDDLLHDFVLNQMKQRLINMRKPNIFSKAKVSYDAALYALFKWAE